MKKLIATFTVIASPLAAHPFHADGSTHTISVSGAVGAFVLLAVLVTLAKYSGMGK